MVHRLFNKTIPLAALLVVATTTKAHALVTIFDNNDWKLGVGGFMETDMIVDSTRSLTESPGNTPIDAQSTPAGAHGRTQASVRNSRLLMDVNAPEVEGWKARGYFEGDFLGYDPSPAAGGNGESPYFTNPTFRIRQVYLSVTKDSWQFLAGQSWSLFGWQPDFVPATVSVAAIPGTTYERTPHFIGFKTFDLSATQHLKSGISVGRPVQRDAQVPTFDAGLLWTLDSWSATSASSYGDVKTRPLSIGLSGTGRRFQTPGTSFTGYAYAVDAFIPILPKKDGDSGQSLALQGEFSQGKGFGDEFPSWTGNLPAFFTTTANSTAPNLDAGQAGLDSSGNFKLVNLTSWNVTLQYHLPASWRTWIDIGYAQLSSSNVSDLTPVANKTLYNRSGALFANVFHDFTKQVRVAFEYSLFQTHYVESDNTQDNRYMLSSWFRF